MGENREGKASKSAANATSIVVGIVRVVDGNGGRGDESGATVGRLRRSDVGQLRVKKFAQFENRFVLDESAIKLVNAGRGGSGATLGGTRGTVAEFCAVATVVIVATVKTAALDGRAEDVRVRFRRVEQATKGRRGPETLSERRANFFLFAFAIVALLTFGTREINDKNVRRFGRDLAKGRRLRRQNAAEFARRVEPNVDELFGGKSQPRGVGDRFLRRFFIAVARLRRRRRRRIFVASDRTRRKGAPDERRRLKGTRRFGKTGRRRRNFWTRERRLRVGNVDFRFERTRFGEKIRGLFVDRRRVRRRRGDWTFRAIRRGGSGGASKRPGSNISA